MRNRDRVAFGAVAVVALLPLVALASAATPARVTVASSTADGFRITVTATRTSGGEAPTATVTVTAFKSDGGAWMSLGRIRLGRENGFFWKVLTGAHAVRELSIGTSSPEHGAVQLLLSPALGWSPVYHFHVQAGRLVAGAAR